MLSQQRERKASIPSRADPWSSRIGTVTIRMLKQYKDLEAVRPPRSADGSLGELVREWLTSEQAAV